MNLVVAPFEVKFASGDTGQFDGYGSVFDVVDAHNDVVARNAFRDGLAEMKAQGRSIAMHINHGLRDLDGARGVGRWDAITEDEHGLKVSGTLLGINTDAGRYLYERIKGGGFSGLSIGYVVPPGGSERGKHGGRSIKAAVVREISIVDTPSNAAALITQFKAAIGLPDAANEAAREIEEFKARIAAGELPTEREFERMLRDVAGFSRAQAEAIAGRGYKSLRHRDGGGEAKSPATQAALDGIGAALAGFSLPRF